MKLANSGARAFMICSQRTFNIKRWQLLKQLIKDATTEVQELVPIFPRALKHLEYPITDAVEDMHLVAGTAASRSISAIQL